MTKSPDLNVAKGLSLPLELAARTQCIFAQKGAGKTYTAMVQTEELLAQGRPARSPLRRLTPT